MADMDDKLRTDLLARLDRDFGFKEPRHNRLTGGKCPSCSSKELCQ